MRTSFVFALVLAACGGRDAEPPLTGTGDTRNLDQPTGETEPVVSTDTGVEVIPSDSGDPVLPSDSGDPVLPTESGDPVLPSDSGDPVLPTESGDPVLPSDSGDPVLPTESGDPVLPTESGDPVLPSDTGDSTAMPTDTGGPVVVFPTDSSDETDTSLETDTSWWNPTDSWSFPTDSWPVPSDSWFDSAGDTAAAMCQHTLVITTDGWPTEMGLLIADGQGNIVASYPAGTFTQANSAYTATVSLPSGHYGFFLTDSYGDGWSTGGLSVYDDDGTLVSGPMTMTNGSVMRYAVEIDCDEDTGWTDTGNWFLDDTTDTAVFVDPADYVHTGLPMEWWEGLFDTGPDSGGPSDTSDTSDSGGIWWETSDTVIPLPWDSGDSWWNLLDSAVDTGPTFCEHTISVLTDTYPSEMGLLIADAQGNIVVNVPAGSFTASETVYTISASLPTGHYGVFLTDTWGDGWSGGSLGGGAVSIYGGGQLVAGPMSMPTGTVLRYGVQITCDEDTSAWTDTGSWFLEDTSDSAIFYPGDEFEHTGFSDSWWSGWNDTSVDTAAEYGCALAMLTFGGQDGGDISYTVENSVGDVVFNSAGDHPFGYSSLSWELDTVILPSDTYTIEMADADADGWEGGELALYDEDGNWLGSAELTTGASGSYSFSFTCANDSAVWVDDTNGWDTGWQGAPRWGDTFIDECGYVLTTYGYDDGIYENLSSNFSLYDDQGHLLYDGTIDDLGFANWALDLPDGGYELALNDPNGANSLGINWVIYDADQNVVLDADMVNGTDDSFWFQADCASDTSWSADSGWVNPSLVPEVCEHTVVVLTDDYPTEMGFIIADAQGNIVASYPAGSFTAANSAYTVSVVLPTGHYGVFLTDSWGDGWASGPNGGGALSIYDGADQLVAGPMNMPTGTVLRYGVQITCADDTSTWTDTGSWFLEDTGDSAVFYEPGDFDHTGIPQGWWDNLFDTGWVDTSVSPVETGDTSWDSWLP